MTLTVCYLALAWYVAGTELALAAFEEGYVDRPGHAAIAVLVTAPILPAFFMLRLVFVRDAR